MVKFVPNEKVKEMKSRINILFLMGMGLMFFFRILTKIPGLPETVFGFDTPKLMKIIFGLTFIIASIIIYRKPQKSTP
ncbi:hypothetical protein [Algoriphagus sp.]|uniref:hypothetical protein n=1 Tax=Algoriphagus sp. TaxID=1872435 RepID=UPI003919805D